MLFDGDNDDTPGGDFYGLFAARDEDVVHRFVWRTCLARRQGGGKINVWRELDGDIDQLSVVGPARRAASSSGSVTHAFGSRRHGLHRGGDDSGRVAADA